MWAKNEGVLGPDPGQGDKREVICLNRAFRWCLPTGDRPEATEIEADARHVDVLTHQLNLKGAKSVASLGVKSTTSDVGPPLPVHQHTPFRSMCIRVNYLAEDRPDVKFSCKDIARLMSETCEAGWQKLKRSGRYLIRVPRLVQRMERQNHPKRVLALIDSDHAGCFRTRRLTTSNILTHGHHFLKMICSTQTQIALSSGESEWYALTHAACAITGLKNLSRDLGRNLEAHLMGDASAASVIGARRIVGKMRHLGTRSLWLRRKTSLRRRSYCNARKDQGIRATLERSTSIRRQCWASS